MPVEKAAVLRVSYGLLSRLLMLPDNCTVIAVADRFGENCLSVKIACPAFPAAGEGEPLPVVEPVYRQTSTPYGRVDHFAGWHGLPGEGHELSRPQ